MHILGYVVQQPRLSVAAMFTGVFGLMGLAWGRAWLQESVFPFWLFIFSVPLAAWLTALTFPLRLLVTWLVTVIANLLTINVVRQGTILFGPGGSYQYEVAAACSGMRSLVAIFLLATVYGFVVFRSPRKRLLLMALALPLSVLGNLVRMLCIIFAAEIGGQATGNYVHESGIFSMIPYIPAIAGLLLAGRWLEKKIGGEAQMNPSRQKVFLFALTVALIGGTAGAVTWLKAHQRLGAPGLKATPIPDSVMMHVELPPRVLDFTSTNLPEAQTVLDYLPKDTSFASRHYFAPDGAWAQANAILMGADRTSIHRPDYCLPGQGWQIRDKTEVKLKIAGAPPYELPVMKWIISNTFPAPDGSKQTVSGLYVFWFVTRGQTTDDFPTMLKSMLFHQLAHGVLQRWAYVSYFTACAPGQEDATFARMRQLIAASVPNFNCRRRIQNELNSFSRPLC